jgi:hypothetical protein
MTIGAVSAAIAGVLLGLISLIHIYWAVGGHWPGNSTQNLTETVVGVARDQGMPGPAACLLVAACLAVAAVLPAIHVGLIPIEVPEIALTVGLWGLVGVFALRGLGGLFERHFRPSIIGLPYDRLNRVLYSPLSLVLAALVSLSTLLH